MMHGAMPLNLSLEWPSVWEGKSLKFLRKMKDSGGGCVMCMDMLCIWICYVYGGVMYMDVLCKWMCYVH